jgi:hypothetical protein
MLRLSSIGFSPAVMLPIEDLCGLLGSA